MNFADAVAQVAQGVSLSRTEARDAMTALMTGQTTSAEIAAYLSALRAKGEAVDELAGSAEAMRAVSLRITNAAIPIVDTCGTGGDGQNLFNVSTLAAFVVAGAGFTVAKHGNRSISSRCGSADLLMALDIPIDVPVARVESCLKEVGIAFLFAPVFHPAMRYAAPVRKELGVRTIFNLLGPLTNPAGAQVQIIGVYERRWVRPLADALVEIGAKNGIVVHGDGADEIVLSGPTSVAEIVDGVIHEETWTPESFGLVTHKEKLGMGGSPAENAAIARRVLGGERGPARAIVCMNAAAVLRAAYREKPNDKKDLSLKEAYGKAEEAIDSTAALRKLEALKAYLAGLVKP